MFSHLKYACSPTLYFSLESALTSGIVADGGDGSAEPRQTTWRRGG